MAKFELEFDLCKSMKPEDRIVNVPDEILDGIEDTEEREEVIKSYVNQKSLKLIKLYHDFIYKPVKKQGERYEK